MRDLIGAPAPFFALDDQFGARHTAVDYAGSALLIVFYPFAFSPICTSELGALNTLVADSPVGGLSVACVSVDSKYTLRAFVEQQSLSLTLLSDFWPHGRFASRCGAFDAGAGRAGRGTLIVDRDGIVRAAELGRPGQARDLGAWVRAAAGYAGA